MTTVKKAFFYLFLFLTLMFINLQVFAALVRRKAIIISTNKVLAEIDNSLKTDSQFSHSSAPLILGEYTSVTQVGDGRVANLKSFFRKHNSPLYDYADYIVKTSDKYEFDYRLIPAIAMQESNLCKFIPEDSYNCWGWGIYGTTVTKFDNFEEAIEIVSKGLRENYINKGLVTASAIMEKYTPSSNGSWAHGVNTFLDVLQ